MVHSGKANRFSRLQTAFFAALLALPGTQAWAGGHSSGGFEIKPYVGGGFGLYSVDYSDNEYESYVPTDFTGFNVHAGLRLHEYFGVEIGVFRVLEKKKSFQAQVLTMTISGETKTRYSGYYADLIGYLPLSSLTEEESGWELLGSVGFGQIDAKWSVSAGPNLPVFGETGSDDDSTVRYGIGVQYHMSGHFSARAMVRYINVDLGGQVNDGQVVDVGLNYKL